LDIQVERMADLAQVGEAGHLPGLVTGAGEDGEEDRRDDCDDRYHDEQLDQREGCLALTSHDTRPSEVWWICGAVLCQAASSLQVTRVPGCSSITFYRCGAPWRGPRSHQGAPAPPSTAAWGRACPPAGRAPPRRTPSARARRRPGHPPHG